MSGACPTLGFMLTARCSDVTRDAQVNQLTYALVVFLEANGLMAGGGSDRAIAWAITRIGAQATDADRGLVQSWFDQTPQFVDVVLSPIVDLGQP